MIRIGKIKECSAVGSGKKHCPFRDNIHSDEKIEAGDYRRKLIEQYSDLEHLNRQIVDTLIDHISVGKRIKGTKDVPIEIYWNF